MTAANQAQLTYDRPAGLLTYAHAKAATNPTQNEETGEQPRTAGFRTNARGAKAAQAGGSDAPANALAPTMLFDNAAFLKLLAQIYGVEEIEKEHASKLSGFTLDQSKGDQNGADGTLYAKVGEANVEITKESVLTDSALTPALAYQMAAAVAANPHSGKLTLEGTDDEKIMLFFAAQQLGLEIEDSSIPEIPENIADLAKKFHDYEREMDLPNIAGTYMPEEKKAPVKKPPRPAQTSAAPMGALSPA